MISKLTLLNRYMFITTEEQAKELLHLANETPKALNGLLILLDSNLVISKRHAYKLTTVLVYLITQSRKLGLRVLIVKNEETNLDKRIEGQLTHTSKIVSEEWPEEVTL